MTAPSALINSGEDRSHLADGIQIATTDGPVIQAVTQGNALRPGGRVASSVLKQSDGGYGGADELSAAHVSVSLWILPGLKDEVVQHERAGYREQGRLGVGMPNVLLVAEDHVESGSGVFGCPVKCGVENRLHLWSWADHTAGLPFGNGAGADPEMLSEYAETHAQRVTQRPSLRTCPARDWFHVIHPRVSVRVAATSVGGDVQRSGSAPAALRRTQGRPPAESLKAMTDEASPRRGSPPRWPNGS